MQIANREGFAAAAKKRLPYDAEVEYLQSSGTQWINTGVVPNTATGCSIRFGRYASSVTTYVPIGSRTSGGNDRWWINPNSTANGLAVFFGRGAAYQQNWPHALDTMYTATMNFQGNGLFTFNAQSVRAQGSLTGACPIWLFGANVSGSLSLSPSGIRIAYSKLTQGSVIVRDYIPVRVGSGSSAVGYMYDKVSGTLFGNAGTGSFTIGPDKTA